MVQSVQGKALHKLYQLVQEKMFYEWYDSLTMEEKEQYEYIKKQKKEAKEKEFETTMYSLAQMIAPFFNRVPGMW